MGKTKQLYVILALVNCCFVITSFDLWMSKGVYDICSLIINFLGVDQQPKDITIGIFEAFDTFGHVLAKNLIKMFNK